MTKARADSDGAVPLSGSVSLDTRYSFTAQFLKAAAMQARLSVAIEAAQANEVTEEEKVAHRGYVVGAIMQASAALECEIWEVAAHGPGHHLGSGLIDEVGRRFLAPLAQIMDYQDTLSRYAMVLHLLKKDPLPRGTGPWQDASLVVRLRNELVHYKSRWGTDLERSKLFASLRQKRHPRPPFVPTGTNFFPHQCLSASCAAWATESCALFLDAFYRNLGVPTPLEPHRLALMVRP